MEEKIILNLGNGCNETQDVVICGNTVKVRKYISHSERISFAIEYASYIGVIDEDKEYAYFGYEHHMIKNYLVYKYYTNIDVSEYEDKKEELYDAMRPYESDIMKVCQEDIWVTESMASSFLNTIVQNYNKEHSMLYKLMMSLGGVITGKDIMKTLAESKVINEEMIDLLERANKPVNNVEWANFAKKPE